MKMTAEAAERQAEQSAANPNTMSSVMEEVYGDRSTAQLSIVKSQNACILDKSGFIACGPIVGYERPADPVDRPWILDGKPTKPIDELLNGGKPIKPMDDLSNGGKPTKPMDDLSNGGKPTKPMDDLSNGGKPTKPMDDRSGGKPSKPTADEWIYDLDRPARK